EMTRGKSITLLCIFILMLTRLVQAERRAAANGPADKQPSTETPSYRATIQPLLETKCLRCHKGKDPKGELDLSTPAGIMKGGESGSVITPGKPESSLLYEKVHRGLMPPGKNERLGAADVETICRWIAAGAQADGGEA